MVICSYEEKLFQEDGSECFVLYEAIKSERFINESGIIVVYGINVYFKNEDCDDNCFVNDVSTDEKIVLDIVNAMAINKAFPIHTLDIIEDYISI